ncbi:MAG: glycosyltransferase [Christensenellales bacterium]
MKIAIVIDVYQDKGNGTSMSARHFVKGLLDRGHEVTILCTENKDKTKIGNEEIIEFPILVIPAYQKIIEKQHSLIAKPDDEKIREALKDVDVVHIYMPFFLGTHCAKIAHELDKPILGCYHISAQNITYNAGMKYIIGATDVAYLAMKNIHYRYDWIKYIYCPSRCIAATVLKYSYKQNLHIISNGYDPIFRRLENDVSKKYENKILIVSVGRLTEEKRQDLIIKAIGKSKYKDKIVLVLAGKGPKQAYYERLAKKCKVDLQIKFLGQNDLVNLLNEAYLFIQASDVETESISCLEAIACGTVPIISNANMCATKQFSRHQKSLFHKGSVRSLASKIDFWIENENLHAEMRNEYAEFAKRFSLGHTIDSTLEVYEFMLKKQNYEYVIKDYNNPLSLVLSSTVSKNQIKIRAGLLHHLRRLLLNA